MTVESPLDYLDEIKEAERPCLDPGDALLLAEEEEDKEDESLEDDYYLDSYSTERVNISHKVANSVSKMNHLASTKRSAVQGRDDRATSEQVLDPRTRLILFKLLQNNMLEKIDGCLSTGKEANVYYAVDMNGREYALKVYKTSILVFKDRDKYVAGENRWKQYPKGRKMVQLWAEKEMRNYKRIHAAGILCPEPILLKSHVLVMQFLGTDGWPSPRLKDAKLSERRLREAYVQCVLIVRHMYQRCRLVHGDLSEYNLLWHEENVYVIDVSQSVETDHPSALDFLRKDCSNVNDFFRPLPVMTTRQLFEFVTCPLGESEELDCLDAMMQHIIADKSYTSEQERRQAQQQEQVDEAVFMSSFLPRSLNQVADYEIQQLQQGTVEDSYALAVASLTGNPAVVKAVAAESKSVQSILLSSMSSSSSSEQRKQPSSNHVRIVEPSEAANDGEHADACSISDGEDDCSSCSANSDSEGSSLSDSSSSDARYVNKPMTAEELEARRAEVKAIRKENKKQVKEAQSERRQHKIKKKDKRRAIKKAKAGNSKNR
jgi:RIO kinase 1